MHIFKKFKWVRLMYIIPFIFCVFCALAYWIYGSYVAEDGTLVEAFGFVPFGMLLLVIGALGLIITEVVLWFMGRKEVAC